MDRASSLIFPGSKTLAGWWRQLAPYQPRALAVGYGFVHRIEAAVQVQVEQPVEPLARLILQAISLTSGGDAGAAELGAQLRLPGVVVHHALTHMHTNGLLAMAGERWRPTERGRHALQHGAVGVRAAARRVFPFLERLDSSGQRVAAPHFVPLAECIGAPWPVDERHQFEVAALQRDITAPPANKQASGFPLDVEALADGPDLENWQRVVVDRPERVMLVLLAGKDEVQGLAVKVDGWALFERTPVVRLPAPAEALWPETPTAAVCQEAWRGWCKQRQLPIGEVDACALAYQPPRLEVQAPARLLQRLQAAKSDLFRGEAWLLVGDGYLRTAALLAVRANA
jgi:hypothetical protein